MSLATICSRGVLTLLFLLVCVSSSLAQREFIDRSSSGTAFELGYSGSEDIGGIAGAVAFTSDRDLDMGFGIGIFEAGTYTTIYSFSLNTGYFIVKEYTDNGRLFFSIDASFMHDWYKSGSGSYGMSKSFSGIAIGPTVTFGTRSDKAQLLLSGGLSYYDMASVNERDNWIKSAGLALTFSRSGTGWLGFTVGYGNNDGIGTYSAGLLIINERF